MTTNIDRAADVINSFCCGYCEYFGQEQSRALADAGLLAPDLTEFDDQDLVGVDDYGHIFVRHEVDDQWLAIEEARDLALALLAAADHARATWEVTDE